MPSLHELPAAPCILLAVSLASAANVDALRAITLSRSDVFSLELVLRIILSFLPESIDPERYTAFVADLADQRKDEEVDGILVAAAEQVDLGDFASITADDATSKLQRLPLRPLRYSPGSRAAASLLKEAPNDPLVRFLISRAYAIDRETGMLAMIPRLLRPFLNKSVYLRTWYVSNILPLVRLGSEYYGQGEPSIPLDHLEELNDQEALETLMSNSVQVARAGHAVPDEVSRDLRGLVGPWTFGSSQRKRRRLGYQPLPLDGEERLRRSAADEGDHKLRCKVSKCNKLFQDGQAWRAHVEEAHARLYQTIKNEILHGPDAPRNILDADPNQESATTDLQLCWQHTFEWLVHQATEDFNFAVTAFQGWDGPPDVDLGDADEEEGALAIDQETRDDLLMKYCRAIFAAVYATSDDTPQATRNAHTLLARLAELLDFVPPPDLATSVEQLPRIERENSLSDAPPKHFLQPESLLLPNQALTMPTVESYSMLQIFTYSAYLLEGLGHSVSIAQVFKLSFWSDATDCLRLLRTLLSGLLANSKIEADMYGYNRDILIYLWNWSLPVNTEASGQGYGVFGQIPYEVLETEILKTILSAGHFDLARKLYLQPGPKQKPLKIEQVEATIVALIHEHYDNASNGNRTRGSMKKSSDLLAAFSRDFSDSKAFRECSALIAATHALSFYSLTFEGGVPTRPVRIREADDPIEIITTVLSQNARSYAKLDDLISIGRNLGIALPRPATISFLDFSAADTSSLSNENKLLSISQRVTGAAIEAALAEDDFETAYSYVVNRLTAPAATSSGPGRLEDDVSWRAALSAGKNRTAPLPTTAKQTRRLEQRLELLAQALSLAPPPALPEILAAWRRCEEELLTLLAATAEQERAADDAAEKRLSGTARGPLPGGFGDEALEPAFSVQPKRREVGRGSAEEAPMGLFDVARGAARAFGRSVGQGQGQGQRAQPQHQPKPTAPPKQAPQPEKEDEAEWGEWGEEDDDGSAAEARVRKRDYVANSFARGVGWVLGATPVEGQGQGQGHEQR